MSLNCTVCVCVNRHLPAHVTAGLTLGHEGACQIHQALALGPGLNAGISMEQASLGRKLENHGYDF